MVHATIVLTFRCLNCSFFGSPGVFEVNFFQTLPADKENNYLISENEQSCRYDAIMIDLTPLAFQSCPHTPWDLFVSSLRRLLVPAQA